MLIELPSKEVKELFEGDFTQTSGSQRKDDHHPHPPSTPHFPRASLHDCSALRAHAHTSAAAAQQPRGAPGSPAPCPGHRHRPSSAPPGPAQRPRPRREAAGSSAVHSHHPFGAGVRSASLPSPSYASRRPYLKGVLPARGELPGHRAALRGAPRCRSGSSVPPRRFSQHGRGCGSRSGGSAPRAAPRASAGMKRSPLLTLCLHDSQRLRDGIYDFQYAALHAPTPALKAPLDVVFPAVSLTGIAASTAGEVIVLCVREERCHALGSEHSPRAAEGGTGSAG